MEVTALGLGGGGRYFEPVPNDEAGAELVRQAIERGITFIETAANYGPADGADRAIRKMVDQKVVRSRGFSCHDPFPALQLIEQLQPGAMQLPINATRVPDFEADVLSLAATRGIAVVAMKTCGHGFFRRDAVDGRFDSRFLSDRRRELHQFAPPEEAFAKPHPTPDEFTRYALSLPIATAVVGMDSQATLDALVRVAAMATLSPAERGSIGERAQVFASTGYWIPRQAQRG